MASRTALPIVDRLSAWRVTRHISVPGGLFAIAFYMGSLTPSLLPRPWHLQGLIAGICGFFGFAIGTGIGSMTHRFSQWAGLTLTMQPRARRILLTMRLVLTALVVVGYPLASIGWQGRTAAFVGETGPGAWFVVASALVAFAVFAVLLGLWRALAAFDRAVRSFGTRVVPRALANVLAGVVVVLVAGFVLNVVVIRGAFAFANRSAAAVNSTAPGGLSAPTSPLRSGGPGSPESWSSLGQDGAIFVSSGPTAAAIRAATGEPAKEPIRAYAGLTGSRSLADVRDAVLKELDRTDAWSRRSIAVFTTTGTGWVDEWSASAFEYLSNGDTAIAAMQYSTLPSAFALLSASTEPPEAGTLLFDAIEQRIATLPAGKRPRLYVSGESLGAFGGNAAFSSPDDLLKRVDGAVWTGTPEFTPIRQTLTTARVRGSTVMNPVADNGIHVRFAAGAAELTADQFGRPLGVWAYPRVVFVQHPSDPVAWWSPDLLTRTPAWLAETRDDNAAGQMSWLPFVTFWQVTADMAVSRDVGGGYGHRYEDELVPIWAAVLGQSGTEWSAITKSIRTAQDALPD